MKKVMVFGVFDLLHPGHINFLEQAKKWGDILIVSIARDTNVKRIKKYKPIFNENDRLRQISALRMVGRAILGGRKSPWPHILREKPDIIALGHDQAEYVANLEYELKHKSLRTKVIRLRAYKPEIYKTSQIRKKLKHAK